MESQVLGDGAGVGRGGVRRVASCNCPAPEPKPDIESAREAPSYERLVLDACQHLKANEKDASIQEHELFLAQAVIVAALNSMTPRQRVKFFSSHGTPLSDGSTVSVRNSSMTGPATAFAGLIAAQTSGFGIYYAASTALGFVTHAVGVSLPFAVYTGMSSTIAVLIGPIGWLSAGLWSAWTITNSDWKSIIPGLIYIINRSYSEN